VAAADTTTPGTTCCQITVGDRADVVFLLRDYFRRLGVTAEVCGPTLVELTSGLSRGDLGKFLADWVRVMDVQAEFVELKPAPVAVAAAPRPTPRLGSLLTAKGFITEEQLSLALNESRETREMLGALLLRKGWIFEEELARTLSEQLDVPYLSVGRVGVNLEVAQLLPREVGEAVAAIPVRSRRGGVQVAFADPTDETAVEAVGTYIEDVSLAVAEFSDIRLAWRSVEPLRQIA
jgi:type II secretion system (T2SS) protein E